MLTDLLWIADGKPWPPDDIDERARLQEHARNQAIYNGLHEKIFPRYIAYLADAPKDSKKQVIILDWPELATSSYLNLLLGEKIQVSAPREDLHERPDEQVFIDASRYGLGFYEISDAGIQALNPENCFLVVSQDNIQKPWAYVFFRAWEDGEGAQKKTKYVKFTIHTKGQIQHLVFEEKNGKLLGPKDLKTFPAFSSLKTDSKGLQKPNVDDILIVQVNNQLSSERYYGRSDYKPSIITLVESLEMSFAQRDEVLAKFTSPTPVIPESATTFDHSTQEWIYKPGKPIIRAPGEESPGLMTWQAELGAVEKAIEQKMDQLLQMLQLSRVLLAGQQMGTAESGTALRIRLIPTLAKVSKYARAAEEAIPQVYYLWTQLHPPIVQKKDIKVLLQDGIPDDPKESADINSVKATTLATLKNARILSGKAALRAAYDAGILQPLPDMDIDQSVEEVWNQTQDDVL